MKALAFWLVALSATAIACDGDPPTKPGSAQSATCEHGVPEAVCTKHHPELIPVFKSKGDWCDEHGLPRSHDRNHADTNTAAAAKDEGEWCKGHGVPESHCTKCHPELVAQFIEKGDFCREHGYPESVCPICHPELPAKSGHDAPTFPDASTRVRLASSSTAHDVGIETLRVTKRAFAKSLDVTGELAFDQNAQAQVSTKDDARVLEVLVDVGDEVKAGQPLVVLASAGAGADRAQLASAAATLEQAKANLTRLERLQGITAQKNLDEARRDVATSQAAYDGAQAALRATGADGASSGGRLVLTSPLAGTVVARNAVAGRTTSAGDVLVHVANTKTLWATLDVPEEHSASVRAGQHVELRFDGLAHETRDGTIAKVGASIDAHTRTVRARVDVDNADGRLKAGLFLRARIAVADEKEALMVPRSAVQRAEGRTLVFVVDTGGDAGASTYKPVVVTLGDGDSERVQILSGLVEGDEVVTTGAFLLKTEILKGSIGAGCCD